MYNIKSWLNRKIKETPWYSQEVRVLVTPESSREGEELQILHLSNKSVPLISVEEVEIVARWLHVLVILSEKVYNVPLRVSCL